MNCPVVFVVVFASYTVTASSSERLRAGHKPYSHGFGSRAVAEMVLPRVKFYWLVYARMTLIYEVILIAHAMIQVSLYGGWRNRSHAVFVLMRSSKELSNCCHTISITTHTERFYFV